VDRLLHGVGERVRFGAGHAMEQAVHKREWDQTGAVRWTFHGPGLNHRIGWDKQRNRAQVRWKKHLVHLDVAKRSGRAWTDGVEQSGAEQAKLVDTAVKLFFNDSFWLNPVVKLFDDGVTREKVIVDGKPALLVKYSSGGVTPGDKYLWLLDENNRPVAWRMWVQVFKIPGLKVTWQDWVTLPTGAQVATKHRSLGLDGVSIRELQAAESWDKLPQEQ
jgi:hypothetical protein